ncbi:AraC family transcriptional regulator [Paenibacillus oceani]|uniref:AraC family transcriptional regulator n=1 Tax=Paenibacillus oceani TaxID=2772510 RepID=A0A927H371_9BACL|nr:AraC family transcriptional regulator [Paenibacillus oceani]MBD2866118.1 AraC family transcriptional regulator [Paenibacillus oceani]
MSMKKVPIYEDFVGGVPNLIIGNERFYIDIRDSRHSYLHHHNFAEISFFFEGSGVETINGVEYELKQGSVTVILPHHMHIIKTDKERQLRKYCCMFDLQLLSGMKEDSWFSRMLYGIGSGTPSSVLFKGQESERMEGIFGHLLQEFHNTSSPGRPNMIKAKLNEAMLLFIRKGLDVASSSGSRTSSPSAEETPLLWPILKYLHTHCTEKLTLTELSSQFHLSVPYMSRFFKEHVGMGFVEYLHRLRIQRATNMLLYTDKTITDIAYEVGFDNSRTFSRVFREQKGRSAREYRLVQMK